MLFWTKQEKIGNNFADIMRKDTETISFTNTHTHTYTRKKFNFLRKFFLSCGHVLQDTVEKFCDINCIKSRRLYKNNKAKAKR